MPSKVSTQLKPLSNSESSKGVSSKRKHVTSFGLTPAPKTPLQQKESVSKDFPKNHFTKQNGVSSNSNDCNFKRMAASRCVAKQSTFSSGKERRETSTMPNDWFQDEILFA
jgi:hypothetical protein